MSERGIMHGALAAALGDAFEVFRELGTGDSSLTFVVRDLRVGRDVIARIPDSVLTTGASLDRFLREIRVATQLDEPHIAPAISAGMTSSGQLFYTRAFVRGDSLRERMDHDRVPADETLTIMRDVARALTYAHKHGVIHRELRPESVWLSFGSAIVTDFGISKALQAARLRTSGGGALTKVPLTLHMARYMAPEQATGDETDARTDFYAWGVIAYEMLSGTHPFPGKRTAEEYASAHLNEQPVHLLLKMPNTSSSLSDLVMQCLEKNPANRPISASEIVHALEDTQMLTRPTPTTIASIEQPRTDNLLLRGALLILAALVLFGTPEIAPYVRDLRFHNASPTSASALMSIAVLPFSFAGTDSSHAYLRTALARELGVALSRVPGMHVTGWGAARRYDGVHVATLDAGKAFSVDAVLTGAVQQSGNALRLKAQLTSALDGRIRWAHTYNVPLAGVFDLQDDLTASLAAEIAPASKGKVDAQASRGTRDPIAYDLFLRGTNDEMRDSSGLAAAETFLRQAVNRDSAFARAYARLAQLYILHRAADRVHGDSLARVARVAADRAVKLDKSLGEGHDALGLALAAAVDPTAAEGEFLRAQQLAPFDATIAGHHAENLLALGRVREAFTEARALETRDHASAATITPLLESQYVLRTFDDALVTAQRILVLDSARSDTRVELGFIYLAKGETDSAIVIGERLLRASPYGMSGVRGELVLAYAAANRWPDAMRIRRVILANSVSRDGYEAIVAHLAFGNRNAALSLLEAAESRISDITLLSSGVGCDPVFDLLKDEPRYLAMLARRQILSCPATTAWPVRGKPPAP